MGAELSVAVLEIRKGKNPDWAAAEEVLSKTPGELAARIVEDIPDEEEVTFDEGCAKVRLEQALEAVRDGWVDSRRDMTRLALAHTDALIAAGPTWGDQVESVEHIDLFIQAGMALAAGFIV